MNIKHLRTFVAVAERGTIAKAAQALHFTQPALSRQISSFEETLGFQLFERVGRGLQLTPRGEEWLRECRDLLAHADTLRERVRTLRQGEIKVLRVVASEEPIEGVFPTFLHRYAEHFPGLRLALIEADPSAHLSMLERGEAHLAATVVNIMQVDESRFGSYLLPQFHILAACAPSLGISQVDAIDIRQLVEHPLLLPKSNFVTRILFDAACRLAGVRLNTFVESASSHALLALAKAGHGVAIVPSIVRTDRRALQAMRVMQTHEPLRIAPAVLWARRRTLPHFAEKFSELLAMHVRERFPRSRPMRLTEPTLRMNLAVMCAPSCATQPVRSVFDRNDTA